MTKKTLTLILTIILAFSLGCSEDDDDMTDDIEAVRIETFTYSAFGVEGLTITNVNGYIYISNAQNDSVTVHITKRCRGNDREDSEAHLDSIVVIEEASTERIELQIDIPENDQRQYNADFDITLPNTLALLLTSVNGEIKIDNHAQSILAMTVNGNLDVDMDVLPSGSSVDLSCTNGNISLDLPSNVSAEFMARVTNGAITINGFPAIQYTTDEEKFKTGIIGAGEAGVHLAIVNGNIEMKGY